MSPRERAELIADLLKERTSLERARAWDASCDVQDEIDGQLGVLRSDVGADRAEELVAEAEGGWWL